MPKLSGNNPFLVEIGLEQIEETGNVRKSYTPEEINELAKSILKCGLINPITVKKMEIDENGIQKYELIAGHRRIRAIKKLQSDGYDFSRVKATIITGNKDILQLVENVQRQDLTAEDKETALLELVKKGMTQKEISEELGKPLSWVSDTLAGNRVRENLTAQDIDTTGISTPALSQLRSIPKEELPEAIAEVKKEGSTVKAATKVLKDYRKKTSKPDNHSADHEETFDSFEPEFDDEPVETKTFNSNETISITEVVSKIEKYSKETCELYKDDSVHKAIIKTVCEDLAELFKEK